MMGLDYQSELTLPGSHVKARIRVTIGPKSLTITGPKKAGRSRRTDGLQEGEARLVTPRTEGRDRSAPGSRLDVRLRPVAGRGVVNVEPPTIFGRPGKLRSAVKGWRILQLLLVQIDDVTPADFVVF